MVGDSDTQGAKSFLNLDGVDFTTWLETTVKQLGGHSVAAIRMDNSHLREGIAASSIINRAWLQGGHHGEMSYLEQMSPAKADPWKTFPFAKTVIVVAFTNQWSGAPTSHPFPQPKSDALLGYISAHARGIDYHINGQKLLAQLATMLGSELKSEVTVDTQPVNERLFATIGGIGVIGSNDLVRIPGHIGSRTFIGCLFVDVELPEVIHTPQFQLPCSDCGACINGCPTGAITVNQPIDARKCISYLTIEKGGLLSTREAKSIGDWLYGCDFCTRVCPPMVADMRIPIDLEWLFKTSAGKIRQTIKGNATSYAGVTKLRRNGVAILKNMDNPVAADLLSWICANTGSELVRQQIESN